MPPILERVAWRRVLLALSIGCAGGGLFAWLGAPLAWMLGSMIAVTAASLSGARPLIPTGMRSVMITILGVMLGSSFTPEFLEHLRGWGSSVGLLIGFLVATMSVAYAYFRHAVGLDRVTAYFSAAPGGLSEMILLSERYGGDGRIVSLMHATRLLMVVAIIPVYFRVFAGVDVPSLPPGGTRLVGIALGDAALLAACAVIGQPLAKMVRLPAAALVGPMLLSAAVHMAGLSSASPPIELIAAAQVVIGTAIGARFVGLNLAQLWRPIVTAFGSGAIMIAASVIAALLFAGPLGLGVAALMLALSPGGLAEMGLIALSLDIDIAYVSAMHVMRITLVVLFAPLVFLWIRRNAALRGGRSG